MAERIWSEQEIATFRAVEPQLAARGMYIDGDRGTKNGEQFLRWFDRNPHEPVTVERLLWLFEKLKEIPNGIFFKSDAQMRFEKYAAKLAPDDLDILERFLKSNRLWPDDEGGYHNGALFILFMDNRPWNFHTLANYALPYIQGNSREALCWKTPGQPSTYRLTGKHCGGDAHFAPKAESNVGSGFVGRIDHAKHPSTEIPRPVSSSKMDAYQWDRLANSLVAESGRHSDTAAIQRAVKTAGGGEPGYKAGVEMQRRLRVERERGR